MGYLPYEICKIAHIKRLLSPPVNEIFSPIKDLSHVVNIKSK